MVGQSRAFWTFVAPLVKKHFPQLEDVSAEDLYRYANRLRPDCAIRVDADELAYPLHVVCRFEVLSLLSFCVFVFVVFRCTFVCGDGDAKTGNRNGLASLGGLEFNPFHPC